MTNLVSYPSSVLIGEFFNIEVDSAPIGWSYGVYDYTTGSTLASGVVEATSFTIICSGLTEPIGPHNIELILFLDINNVESIPLEISATDSAFNASVNTTYNGALFRSLVVFWYDIATSNSTITIDSAAPRTFVLDNVYLSPSVGIEPGDFITVRSATGSPGSFGGGQGEANVVSYNPTTQELVVTFSGWNVTTASSWYISFLQPKYLLGEDVYDIFPITVTGSTSGLTYSQVDLGNGLLPNWLTLNSSTGEITGKVPSFPIPEVQGPGAMMAPYQVGISVTDGISTQVVSWTFGGVTGFYAAEITDPISRSALYSIPVGFLYPEGTVELISYNLTTGATTNNGYATLGAGGGGIAAGSGTLPFATPTPGKYAFNGKLMAFEGSSYTVDVWFGGSVSPVSGISSGGVTVFEGARPALTTVTNSATYRINETISPLTIATGSGGSYPLIYRVSGYLLPEGLEVNTSTGVITGTPTTFGDPNRDPNQPFAHVLIATDGVRDSNPVYFNINILGPLSTNTVIPNSTVIVGVPVSLTPVTVSNAVGATTWSISPSVPAGLTFSTSNGQLFGTASGTSPSTTYSITVQDSEGQLSTSTFNLTVETSNLATTLVIPGITLSINAGMTASTPVTHTGGYGAITYSVSPLLPTGLIFNTSNGTITGTPLAVQGATSYTITVRDEAGQTSSQSFSITILSQLSALVLNPTLAFPRNEPISPVIPVTGVGGVPPYGYSVSPTLPTGLSYNSANGEITGTPSISSSSTNYTVIVVDANSRLASGSFTLRIEPLVVVASTTDLIKADDYNDIKFLTEEILGIGVTGYGYRGLKSISTVTSSTSIIGWQEWSNLKDDINLITAHQTGNYFNYTTATVITAEFVNQLVTNLNEAEPKRYQLPPQNNTGTTSSIWTSTYTVEWPSEISTTATFTWPTGLNINYFFNLGGKINFDLDYLPSGSSAENSGWRYLIDDSRSLISNFVYDVDNYSSTLSLSTSSTTGTIGISVVAANNTLTCSIQLSNNLSGVTLQVRGTVSYTYSDSVLKAPLPAEIELKEFNTGTFIPVILPTKILRLSVPANTYSCIAGSSSTARTITLQNIGNQPVLVSSIVFTDNPNVDRIVNGVRDGNISPVPFTITTTTPFTFSLAYTGTTIGSFNSSFVINSDNDSGVISTSTIQTVSAVPFNFSINPPSISISYNSPSVWTQSFSIDANQEFSSYSASLTVGEANFTIDTGPSTGPIVKFNPIGKISGVYPATLSITVNGVTRTASISINLTAVVSTNLGSWLSPQTTDNTIIGISYDVIATERYLTIAIANISQSFLNLNSLGVDGDSGYKYGLQQYPAVGGGWGAFLTSLAVWPNASAAVPTNINVGSTAIYRFTAPVAGTYTYEYSSDDDSSFSIDFVALPNQLLTGGAKSNWTRSYTGSIDLTAGQHIISYYHVNYGGPAGAAFQIKDPTGNVVWNTRYPIRDGQIYGFWQEVVRFRIPANSTPVDLYSSLWYTKNSFAVDNKYHLGEFFSGDIFKVRDDGFGNLDISFFGTPRSVPTSITNASTFNNIIRRLPTSFYYYLPSSLVPRITNLDTGPAGDGTQTRYFTGFTQDGNVKNVLRNIPTSLPALAPYSPGGGSGGGGRPVDPDIRLLPV